MSHALHPIPKPYTPLWDMNRSSVRIGLVVEILVKVALDRPRNSSSRSNSVKLQSWRQLWYLVADVIVVASVDEGWS